MHVADPRFKSVISFCFFSALRRGWVRRHLALGLVQNRWVVRSRVFAASAALGTRVGLSPGRYRSALELETNPRASRRLAAPLSIYYPGTLVSTQD
jgi:hypothetical protein